MMPVSDTAVIIGDFEGVNGSGQDDLTNNAATYMEGEGYTVYRVPSWNSGATHYTYTNAVIMNELVMVPTYGTTNGGSGSSAYNDEDAEALAVFQAAFPNKTLVQIDCSSIIGSAGAIHCIMMHAARPLYDAFVEVISPNGGDSIPALSQVEIKWIATDDVAVTSLDLYYSDDNGATWNVIATGEPHDNSYMWNTPDIDSSNCLIKIVAHDG